MRWATSISCVLLVCLAVSFRPGLANAYRYKHEVLPGETLKSIARRYHISARTLRRLNRLRSSRIRAGRKLRVVTSVPCRTRVKMPYVVKRRDTLSKVARRHKMKVWLLRRLNARKLRGRHLRPGQTLTVVVERSAPKAGVKGLYQMESGPGYKVRSPARAWGTFLAVTRLHDVLTSYHKRFPRSRAVRLLDLSRKGGGVFPPHKSHRSGRDIDISYVLKRKHKDGLRATPERLDVKRTWFLVKRLVDTGDVTYVFMDWKLQRALYKHALQAGSSKKWLKKVFQYPRSKRVNLGIIRDDPGHDSHFHVRFRRSAAKPKPVS